MYDEGPVSPLEVAQLYAIFASQGVQNGQRLPGGLQPALALYVEDVVSGEVLLDARQPEALVVLSEPLAYLVHHVLSDSIRAPAQPGVPQPAGDWPPGRR
jgi:hypothetical protein